MRQTAPFVIRDLVEEALRTAAPAVNMNKVHHAAHALIAPRPLALP
jgi:hypothetical protein